MGGDDSLVKELIKRGLLLFCLLLIALCGSCVCVCVVSSSFRSVVVVSAGSTVPLFVLCFCCRAAVRSDPQQSVERQTIVQLRF